MISRLHSEDDAVSRLALNELCAAYHFPLYCFIRKRGLAHHDAQDVLHDFLAKLLRLNALFVLDEAKGRLRNFLLKALDRFLITRHHQQNANGGQELLLDDVPIPYESLERRYLAEPLIDRDTPELLFERQWCQQLLTRVLSCLEAAYLAKGRAALFAALRPVLLSGGSLRGYDIAAIAEPLGMTQGALRAALLRLLRDYREHLRSEVAQTVESKADVDDEIACLMQLFASKDPSC